MCTPWMCLKFRSSCIFSSLAHSSSFCSRVPLVWLPKQGLSLQKVVPPLPASFSSSHPGRSRQGPSARERFWEEGCAFKWDVSYSREAAGISARRLQSAWRWGGEQAGVQMRGWRGRVKQGRVLRLLNSRRKSPLCSDSWWGNCTWIILWMVPLNTYSNTEQKELWEEKTEGVSEVIRCTR